MSRDNATKHTNNRKSHPRHDAPSHAAHAAQEPAARKPWVTDGQHRAPAGMAPLSASQRGTGGHGGVSGEGRHARLTSLPDPFSEPEGERGVRMAQDHEGSAPIPVHQPAPEQAEGHDGAAASEEPSGTVRAGYRAPVKNPYLKGSNIGRASQGARPVRPEKENRKGHVGRALIVVAVVFAALVGIWALAWTNRSVTFKLNGEEVATKVGSTVEQVIKDRDLTFTPGNLVSVSGKVLEQGKGDPYSVKLGDKTLTMDEARDLHIEGDEDITLGNGADVMEPYDTKVEETQPKLRMDGNWGSLSYVSQWGKVGKKEIRTGKVSGETAPGDTLQEVQDCVITVRNPTPANGEKLVALTFDDGPSAYTPKYLEILKQYGAKATFFNLGSSIAADPEGAKAIVDAGCQLASHTQNHEELPALTPEQLKEELSATFKQIKDTTGLSTTVIRPPYGEFRERTWLESGGLMSCSVLWTQDSEDWRLPGVSNIVDNSLAGITSGSIILMHDGGGNRDQDVEALPQIIEALQNDGYKLVTVDELMASDPTIPKDIATGDAHMPKDCVWPTELGDA